MADSGPSALTIKLSRFVNFAPDELQALDALEAGEERFQADRELVVEGIGRQDCFVLKDGWAACFKLLVDGRRQIINFSIAGDFLGLRSFLLRTADHSVVTLTSATVARFPQERILELIDQMPRVGTAILWAASREEAIVVEHLVNIGRRNALERTAHLLLELGARLQLVGRTVDGSYHMPLTQEDLADALGLTAVHVNRVLRELRERSLATMVRRRIEIHDLDGLRELAGFHAGYLDHVVNGSFGVAHE